MSITTASEQDTENTQESELAPLLARRELWLMVSAGLVDPFHRERFDLLRNPAFRKRIIQAVGVIGEKQTSIALAPGEVHLQGLSPQELFGALDAQSDSLEPTYRQLFGLTAVSLQCPPCGVEYEPNGDVAYRSQQLADIAGFYRAFGLEVSKQAGERLDHITVEAEFLYVLLAKEVVALAAKDPERAAICHDARRKFFQEHLGWWLPAFARLLSRVAPPGFYRELARFTAGVSDLERVSLGIPPSIRPAMPQRSDAEAEASCAACIGSEQAF